ncbi:MAG: hypothetical protein KAV87_41565 [Desulfobacteraceae bacterium]|nr:hypothetical protein [Desulfobacteraceae bacterium]
MANPYAEKIERLLSPLIGDFMAKMAMKSQCKGLGITPDEIGPQHLDDLAKKIGEALAFHGHKEETDRIVATIKRM